MRTNIVLDETLVKTAMKATGARTKREVVDIALRTLVQRSRRRDILDLVGQGLIDPDYDIRGVRSGKSRGSR